MIYQRTTLTDSVFLNWEVGKTHYFVKINPFQDYIFLNTVYKHSTHVFYVKSGILFKQSTEYIMINKKLYFRIYEAVHERTGRNQKEITVEKGDILEVIY